MFAYSAVFFASCVCVVAEVNALPINRSISHTLKAERRRRRSAFDGGCNKACDLLTTAFFFVLCACVMLLVRTLRWRNGEISLEVEENLEFNHSKSILKNIY